MSDALTGRTLEQQARNILPGAWAVETDKPIATLLGSCVGVCLWDPVLKVGGMNHFMLPEMERRDKDDTDMLLSGNYAMEALLNAMMIKGAKKARIQVKAFGGGNVIANLSGTGIGERNVKFCREWLQREALTLVASDFLGPWSRKIVLNPMTGDAFCRRMGGEDSLAARAAREEAAYRQTLKTAPKKSNIELF